MQDIYKNFLTPKNIQVLAVGKMASKIVLEPLERGFGHTLGNALRRILLSSMVGAAIIEASIEGVLHEYSSIDGVREDVVDILLNLKGVAIRLEGRDAITLTLIKRGPGVVKAGDIKPENGVEIINTLFAKALLGEAFIEHVGSVQNDLKKHRLKNFTGAMLMHHTISSTKYMARWIEAKNKV